MMVLEKLVCAVLKCLDGLVSGISLVYLDELNQVPRFSLNSWSHMRHSREKRSMISLSLDTKRRFQCSMDAQNIPKKPPYFGLSSFKLLTLGGL